MIIKISCQKKVEVIETIEFHIERLKTRGFLSKLGAWGQTPLITSFSMVTCNTHHHYKTKPHFRNTECRKKTKPKSNLCNHLHLQFLYSIYCQSKQINDLQKTERINVLSIVFASLN